MLLYDVLSEKTKFADEFMKEPFMPVTSGLESIDDHAGKLNPGETIILTSADAVTKTAFALNIAVKNASFQRIPAVMFSSLMPVEQIAKWVIMSLNDHQIMSKHTPLYLEAVDKLNAADLKEKIVSLKRSSLVEIVIIDSIDMVYRSLPDTDGQRIKAIYDFVHELKLLAKELNMILILTASIMDKLELPKEIAAVEPLADAVISVYMMERYEDRNKRIVEVSRNGKCVAAREVMFNRRHARFYDIGEDDEPPIYNEEFIREQSFNK